MSRGEMAKSSEASRLLGDDGSSGGGDLGKDDLVAVVVRLHAGLEEEPEEGACGGTAVAGRGEDGGVDGGEEGIPVSGGEAGCLAGFTELGHEEGLL